MSIHPEFDFVRPGYRLRDPATSKAGWHDFKAKKQLGKRFQEVLALLKLTAQPMTGQEIAKTVPNGWKRLVELERLGLIRRCAERRCWVTGEAATTWEIQR